MYGEFSVYAAPPIEPSFNTLIAFAEAAAPREEDHKRKDFRFIFLVFLGMSSFIMLIQS